MSKNKPSIISLAKKSLKDWRVFRKYKHEIPVEPKNDDLYLVAFPKSGLTWLSFLMSSIHLKMSNENAEVTFFNIHNFIPDIHDSSFLAHAPLSFPGFRVIKSHAEFNPFYKRIVYLIRDPRDVMVSYYFYKGSQGSHNQSISEFIRDRKHGINKWVKHVESWLEKSDSSLRAYYIKYEELKSKPVETLNSLYKMMGFSVPAKVINEAVVECSFEKMKENEKFFRSKNPIYEKSFRGEFVRKGTQKNYLEMLSQEDINYISNKAAKYLELFNYTD
jgi:uncharacterized membrane protein YkvA (DUF1232 family)